MKFNLSAATLVILLFTTASQAASEVFIDQVGQNLAPVATSQMVSIEDVSGWATRAAETMETVRSSSNLKNSSSALLVQDGEDNQGTINQLGRGNLGIVMQTGMMNSAAIMQTGYGNSALIVQTGYGNIASVTQIGNNHSAFVAQQGRGNVAIISQR